jgi:hypothetical protein
MPSEHFAQLAALFSAGVGMLLAAAANLVLLRARRGWRAAVTAAVFAAVVGGTWALVGVWRPALGALGLMTVGGVGCLLVGSVAAAGARVAPVVRRPEVRWALLAVVGLGVALGSVIGYEVEESAAVDEDMAELSNLASPPPNRVPCGVRATTDRGTIVPLMEATDPRPDDRLQTIESRVLRTNRHLTQVIQRGPADDRSNCHGWVFTAGRYWVGGALVDQILAENDYRLAAEPAPGDLAVYRTGEAVAHTAVVRYVTAGLPVMVEGKWGCIGVYLHPVDHSIYGTQVTYYRSPRPGHLLTGVGGPSPDAPPR